ncbi:MAG: hypothetical protein FJ096_21940 [Deltaproteobacteria bacterium]|nr:hypothetical protein [Deltaproteobacteria bacterium]
MSAANVPDGDLELAPSRKRIHFVDILGLGAGILPFFLSFSSMKSVSATVTVDGKVVETVEQASHVDYIALGGGGLALLCGLAGLTLVRRARSKGERVALTVGTVALGAF